MTVGGSVHFSNITGLLYNAGKEFRAYIITNVILFVITMPRLYSNRLVYRSWLVLLRRHSRSYTRRRCRTLRRFARSPDRCSPIGQNGNRYWLPNQCFSDQPPRPVVGHARGGLQFWHRHVSHVPSLRFHKQRPSHERGFQVPCQSERIPLRVRAVFHWQTTGRLLNRYSNRLQRGIRRRRSSANHLLPLKSTG